MLFWFLSIIFIICSNQIYGHQTSPNSAHGIVFDDDLKLVVPIRIQVFLLGFVSSQNGLDQDYSEDDFQELLMNSLEAWQPSVINDETVC